MRATILSDHDMTALAQSARNFVAANERRNPEHRWPTLSERMAYEELKANIESLEAKESRAA